MNVSKEHIKSIIIVVLLLSLGLLVFQYFYRGRIAVQYLQEEPKSILPGVSGVSGEIVRGTVQGYGDNHVGDIDKIRLQTQARKIWLHFPPHTAREVLIIANKNTYVEAEIGKIHHPVAGEQVYELIELRSLKKNERLVIASIPPLPPSNGIETEVSGSAPHFQYNTDGRMKGFVLSGKLIELDPRTAATLGRLLRDAKSIKVNGVARSAENGRVNLQGYTLVKPVSITIDNVNYIIQ